MSRLNTFLVALLFITVPITGISIYNNATDFINDGEINDVEPTPIPTDWQVHYAQSSSYLPTNTNVFLLRVSAT